MSCHLGNPAPLGLLAFGMTTLMLMYVETGWVEADFEAIVYGYAVFFGGLGQLVVAIFELIKGSSFSFAVFGSYSFFWLGWAAVFVERHKLTSTFSEYSYPNGMTAFFAQWGVLTCCFFVITLRKNICLIVTFFCLIMAFFLLAIASGTQSATTKTAAGYFGFFAAVGAFYTGIAELINEEWGRNILPGLSPLYTPERLVITRESISKLISYDKTTNTLLLYFRGLQINSMESVEAIREGVESAILAAKARNNKVHIIADYKDVTIAKEIETEYWNMAHDLERKYYLSVRRFAITSFGTRSAPPVTRRSAIQPQISQGVELDHNTSSRMQESSRNGKTFRHETSDVEGTNPKELKYENSTVA